jgi:hypothetical protein
MNLSIINQYKVQGAVIIAAVAALLAIALVNTANNGSQAARASWGKITRASWG